MRGDEPDTLSVMEAIPMTPRPDLNGLRVQMYGDPNVYLIDEGLKRWIPSPAVMAQLFTLGANWTYKYDPASSSVVLDLSVNEIDDGLPIPDDCLLFMAADSPKVFLRDHDAGGKQIERWITSPAAMDRFQFDWAKINHWNVPLEDVGLPDGPDISYP
jgi:hypothetical protein